MTPARGLRRIGHVQGVFVEHWLSSVMVDFIVARWNITVDPRQTGYWRIAMAKFLERFGTTSHFYDLGWNDVVHSIGGNPRRVVSGGIPQSSV